MYVNIRIADSVPNAADIIFAEITTTNHKGDKLNSVPIVGKPTSQASILYARIVIGLAIKTGEIKANGLSPISRHCRPRSTDFSEKLSV